MPQRINFAKIHPTIITLNSWIRICVYIIIYIYNYININQLIIYVNNCKHVGGHKLVWFPRQNRRVMDNVGRIWLFLFGCTACTPMWVMERPSFLKSKHMGACQNWISLWWSKKCVLIQTQIYSVKSGGCFLKKTSKLWSNNMWGSKLVEYTQTSNQETRTYGGFLSHGGTS